MEANFKETQQENLNWPDLPEEVCNFSVGLVSDEFKNNAVFTRTIGGGFHFALENAQNHWDDAKVDIQDKMSGEIDPEKGTVTIIHRISQFSAVHPMADVMGGGTEVASSEYTYSMVYQDGGRDSLFTIVAANWQLGVKVDANGIVLLDRKKEDEMNLRMESTLGLTNGMKLDLRGTVVNFSRPIGVTDVVSATPVFRLGGAGLPNIPLAMASF